MPPQDRLTEDREQFQVEQLERELSDAKRIRERRKAHAITGGVTLLIFLFLLDLLSLDFINMLNPVSLIFKIVVAAVFGLPTGYLISVRGGGMWRGAWTAAGVFLIVGILLGLPSLSDRSFGSILGPAIMLGMMGLFPGAVIGMHVDMDN